MLSLKVRTKRAQNTIQALKDTDGEVKVSTADIQSAFVKYYSALYSSTDPTRSRILDYLIANFPDKQLSEEHAEALDPPITAKEVADVILKKQQNPR